MDDKPCPFCGNKELIVFHKDMNAAPDLRVQIWCMKCYAMGPSAKHEVEALEKWNKRP